MHWNRSLYAIECGATEATVAEASMKERIGFIGLGNMGEGMATNLLRKGWPLTVTVNKRREAVDRLVAAGATEMPNLRELAEASDIVVLCVTGSPEVEQAVNGPGGIASAGKPLLIIDCSTSDPASTMRLREQLAPGGITLIDAPLGRTPKEAADGTLDVMVGGSEAEVDRARPVLEAFAGRVIYTGPVGTGHTMKLLNNFLSMGYAAIYSEALALGAKAGLTPKVFDSVIRGGRMDCGFYQTFSDYVVNRNPNAHRFALSNGFKDMTYLASFAQSVGLANPIGAAVRNSFALPVAAGKGADFVPTLSDFVARLNGVDLTKA
jgi:3-hydroxyisobutyrate dehydrogenase-like beta-hydroxyacid dehydrogenase